MIRGVGIDMTSISEIAELKRTLTPGALERMFTPRELDAACVAPSPAEYLAARFAAKEAVFKAVAHLLEEKHFDFRQVETLNHPDGSPYINIDDRFRDLLNRANVNNLFISITTEGNLATAFVVAE